MTSSFIFSCSWARIAYAPNESIFESLMTIIIILQVPAFDALYLDMNGIIHNCTHGDPNDESFQLTETQMFSDIADYISTLFRIIKPSFLPLCLPLGLMLVSSLQKRRSTWLLTVLLLEQK